ncbi:MAG: hypothetical protein K6B40_08795 [Firmicutes bacterium]|nr:hypothetical protein [Bacillota bacterium]
MALFGKKEKAKTFCPACGMEMNAGIFGDSKAVADGTICGNCERMLRGKYDIQRYVERKPFSNEIKEKTEDPLRAMSVSMIRELISELKSAQEETLSAYGAAYSSLLTADMVTMIAPKPLDVGIKWAKELKNKLAVRGLVQKGQFAKGDTVLILHEDSEKEVNVLLMIPCDGVTDLDLALKTHANKKEVTENRNAWMILDTEGGIKAGNIIAKR